MLRASDSAVKEFEIDQENFCKFLRSASSCSNNLEAILFEYN